MASFHRIFYVEIAGINHILDQLFGSRSPCASWAPPFIGGLCGDYSPHRTTMTQTKCCPIFAFWVVVVVREEGAQTTVEAPQLLGVSMVIPQVQFCNDRCWGRFLCSSSSLTRSCTCPLSCICSTRWSMPLLCCGMGFRKFSSSTVITSP